jgi:hypothetical protein
MGQPFPRRWVNFKWVVAVLEYADVGVEIFLDMFTALKLDTYILLAE